MVLAKLRPERHLIAAGSALAQAAAVGIGVGLRDECAGTPGAWAPKEGPVTNELDAHLGSPERPRIAADVERWSRNSSLSA